MQGSLPSSQGPPPTSPHPGHGEAGSFAPTLRIGRDPDIWKDRNRIQDSLPQIFTRKSTAKTKRILWLRPSCFFLPSVRFLFLKSKQKPPPGVIYSHSGRDAGLYCFLSPGKGRLNYSTADKTPTIKPPLIFLNSNRNEPPRCPWPSSKSRTFVQPIKNRSQKN